MGRSSSTGYPFLVLRADVGQFTYHRDIPAPLAPLIRGDVLLVWSGHSRALKGKGTIKVSLGTGDEKTARQRWGVVHPQIDALIQLAELRAHGANGSAGSAAAPRLDIAHIRRIADQAYHDVLAIDDQSQLKPGFVTPIASVLLHLTCDSLPSDADTVRAAELVARSVEQRLHKERIQIRNTWTLDEAINESELDGSFLSAVLKDVKEGDRLAPEQVEALARGIPIGEIPSEVERRLKENGFDLPDGHVDRRAIALAMTRAKLRALNDVIKRDRGEPIDTPARSAAVQGIESTPVPPLSAMPERWITMVRPGDKQVSDNARYVRLFIGLHGDLPVDQITGAHIRAFRDGLLECPRNAPNRMANASIVDLTAWAKANPGKPKLSRETINHKALGAISALLEQACKDEHIQSNVVQKQALPTRASDKQPRRPYEVNELNDIFQTSVYLPRPRVPVGGKEWAAWWLPLLSLYTGARLEEIGQALVSDVRRAQGIDYIEVTTILDDEEGSAQDTCKTVKSEAARRRLPLHAVLIRLGFLDYVDFVKATGSKRLFPHLDEYRGRYTKNWSRWWGRWLTKLGLTDKALTFHSFRHTFTAELRRLKCNQSAMKELLGHAQTDVTSGYGRKNGFLHELGDLNDELQRITFLGLDLSRLVGLTPWRRAVCVD